MTRYPAAPLDRGARIATAAVWAFASALAALGVVVTGVLSVPTGLVLLVGAGGVLALVFAFRPRRPVAYVVDDDGIEIERAGAPALRLAGSVGEVRRGRLGFRVAGDGGVYGYLGRFRAERRTVEAFVTSRAAVVLLRVGDREIAVSPSEPDRLVAAFGANHA